MQGAKDTFKAAADTYNKGINLIGQYVVTPKGYEGTCGYIFDVVSEQSISLEAEITDHYVEDNSAIQDNKANKPKQITISGLVGEVVYTGPTIELQTLLLANEKLSSIDAFKPGLTQGAIQTLNKAATKIRNGFALANSLINTGVNLLNTFKKKSNTPTKQAFAYTWLETLYRTNYLCTVSTPFGFFDNMLIQGITATQSSESQSYSDFVIKFKEFRVAKTQFVAFDPSKYQGRAISQMSSEVDGGNAQGKPLSTQERDSFFKQGFNALVGG